MGRNYLRGCLKISFSRGYPPERRITVNDYFVVLPLIAVPVDLHPIRILTPAKNNKLP